jgi:cell division septation protein DedD/GAF domain-containing protein
MDAHRIAGHERDAPAATEEGDSANAGQRGELSARLAAATSTFADGASVEPVVVTIGRALLLLTKAERAAIFLRSPNGRVTCPWSHNLSDVYVQDVVTPKDANPWVHILRHPELSCMDLPKSRQQTSSTPWFLSDVLALSSDHAHLVDRITREGARSVCAWPLTQASRVTGAFVYYYDSPHAYSQDEQEVMSAFGSQAAAALGDPAATHRSQEHAAFAVERPQITETLEAKTIRLAPHPEKTQAGRLQLAEAQARPKAAEVALDHETGRLHEYFPMWDADAKVGPEPADRSSPARPFGWRQALVAVTVIAVVATAVLEFGPKPHGPAVRPMEQKPAALVSVTAVQKRPVPAPHQTIVAGVVPSVAKAGAPPTTPRALPPRKAAYVVVVGTFESATTAEEVKHLVQSKGYVVHVVLQGTVSKVMTAPMRTRAQAESVARGLEAVGLHPQLLVW